MSNKKHIAAFVNDLLKAEPNLVLQSDSTERKQQSVKLAADTPEIMTLSASRVGSLTDDKNNLLIRVYQDKKAQSYRLYLLASNSISPAYAMLSLLGESRFYIADHEAQIEIPFANQLDPLERVFHLNYPRQVAELDRFPENDILLTTDGFELLYDSGLLQLNIKLLQEGATFPNKTTKLVCQYDHSGTPETKLLPIRNLRAVLILENTVDPDSSLTLITYA